MKNFEKLWQELVSEFPEILEHSNEMKSFVKNFIKTKPEIKISKNFKKALEEKIMTLYGVKDLTAWRRANIQMEYLSSLWYRAQT